MVLRTGSKGSAVVAAQKALGAHGYDLRPDGQFGAGTDAAVRQFQASQGLTVDGVIGPNTWDRLLSGPGSLYRDALSFLRKDAIDPKVKGVARKALEHALADVGRHEQPLGSNRGAAIAHLVEGYADFWSIPGRPYLPWCAMAVMVWTGRALGLGADARTMRWREHPIGGKFLGGVAQIAAWGEKSGVSGPGKEAAPGDILIMSRSGSGSDASTSTRAGHTGLIVSVEQGVATTVEGNVSNGVGMRSRPLKSFEMVVHWWKEAR